MALIGETDIFSPVMNAACSVAKSIDDVRALSQTGVGIVLVGSITVAPREGNLEPRWFEGDGFALNSFGMPNGGLEFYELNLAEMVKIAQGADKKFALSVAGFNTEEYVLLSKMANRSGVDFLELNFGCPNVSVEGKQKPIVSFDPDSVKEIISAVRADVNIPLFIKLSPYSNPAELAKIAEVINDCEGVVAVVTSNTFPNGYVSVDGSSVLANGFGGVSGVAMKPIAVGQVRQFRAILKDSISVIGVGGIESREDAKQYFDAGADMVQCATLIVRDGHSAIDSVI